MAVLNGHTGRKAPFDLGLQRVVPGITRRLHDVDVAEFGERAEQLRARDVGTVDRVGSCKRAGKVLRQVRDAGGVARGRRAEGTEKPPDENASKKGFFNWFKSDPKPEAKPEVKPQSAPAAPSSSPVLKESTAQMRGAIADLEKAVRTMPGKDPVIVGPRKAGESAADYLKRWNEAHKND